MIHVYTGNGKGKTTAALGLGLRAVGAGKKVLMVQFLKPQDSPSSEVKAIEDYLPNFEVKSFGRSGFVIKGKTTRRDYQLAQEAWEFVIQAAAKGRYDLIILDEANLALSLGLLNLREMKRFLKEMSEKGIEIVLTGRFALQKIIELADLVTEMKEVKHYYKKGVKARKGVEY